MALNVGTLVAELRLDDSQYNAKIDASESRFSKFGSFLAGAAKVASAAALGGIAAAGAIGISTAASMEQAEIGFTTMLGSGEKAKAFLTDLSAFAAKTPFEFPELQTAASSLVSAGVQANKVIPIMTSLGNATSGMGTGAEGVKRATVALQQMNAAGKITGEDLNQLRDAGIPVYDLLAAATGKSKEAVTELASKGKLGRVELQQLMGALESGKGLERFSGLMAKQSTSLTGLWSTLKDTFSVGMATAIEPLVPLIKDGLGGAIIGVAGFMPKLASGLATTAAVGKQAFDVLFRGDFTGGPLAEDSTAVDVLFRVRDALASTRAGVAEFAAGVTMSKGQTEAYGGALDGLAMVGNRVGVGFRTVLGAAKEFAAGMTMSRGETAAYGAALDGAAAVGNRAGGVLRSVVEAVREFAAGLMTSKGEAAAYGGALDGMALVGLRVREALTAVFEAIRSGDVGALRDGFSGAGDTAAGLLGGLQSLTGLLPSLGTLVGTAADVVRFLADNSSLLVEALPFLIAGFVAYKVAQSAANVAALLSLPILAAQVVANLALASANRALAIALGYERVGMLARIGAFIASTAATIAHTAATVATTVATTVARGAVLAWTGAQWLLNAALSANPIGLVIAAIALLVGGLVIAYRESETFRNIVDGAFQAVKSGAGNAVGFMIEAFRGLLGVWLAVAGGILEGAATALGWIPGLGDKLQGANRAFETMKTGILTTLDEAADKAYAMGEKSGSNVAAGLGSTSGQAFAAGSAVGEEMAKGLGSFDASDGVAVGLAVVNGVGSKSVTDRAFAAGSDVAEALRLGLSTFDVSDGVAVGVAAGAGVAAGMNYELDIQSPSRVTRQIGVYLAEGLALGMRDGVGPVSSMATRLGLAAVPPGISAPAITFPAGAGPRGGDGAAAAPAAGPAAAQGGFTYHVEHMHVTQAPGEDLATALPREMANRAWELGF